jgi:hypothetical protein
LGLFRSLGDLGFVIAPPLVGFFIDQSGYTPAVVVNGVMLASTAVIFVIFAGKKRIPSAPPQPVPANVR